MSDDDGDSISFLLVLVAGVGSRLLLADFSFLNVFFFVFL